MLNMFSLQTRWPRAALGAAILLPSAFVHALQAQDAKITARPRISVIGPSGVLTPSADRAVLGVTLGVATKSDTSGVRVEEVDANGPAAKAGIKAGDLITEINGTSLRVAAADAEDLALTGVTQRRLQRAMAKAKPGDEVELKVRTGGAAARSVRVKTVSARDLEGTNLPRLAIRSGRDATSQAAIGVSIGASGSVRDTLGLFVSSVVGGGPAEKAGVIEGERIAAVNGVDVRVPREDVEDGSVASTRVDRFVKEVQKLTPGAPITLRVYSNGRYREVTVTSVKASDLPSRGWSMSTGDGDFQVFRNFGPGETMMMGRPLEGRSEEVRRTWEERRGRLQDRGRATPPIRVRSGLTRR